MGELFSAFLSPGGTLYSVKWALTNCYSIWWYFKIIKEMTRKWHSIPLHHLIKLIVISSALLKHIIHFISVPILVCVNRRRSSSCSPSLYLRKEQKVSTAFCDHCTVFHGQWDCFNLALIWVKHLTAKYISPTWTGALSLFNSLLLLHLLSCHLLIHSSTCLYWVWALLYLCEWVWLQIFFIL